MGSKILKPDYEAINLVHTYLDLSGKGNPPLKYWHNHSAPGIDFSQPHNQKRVTDPRDKPGHVVRDLPGALMPCELHPVFTAHTFLPVCEEYIWKDGESLWHGTMKASHLELHTHSWSNIYSEIIGFFNHTRTVTWDTKQNKYINHMPQGWRPVWGQPHITDTPDHPPDVSTEMLAKVLWLATEYLDNDKKYTNPMCAHYNPTLKDNIVHPGGMRKKLLKMYNHADDNVEMFYFNTGGFYYDDHMKDLEIKKYRNLMETVFHGGTMGSLVAEHGTLIPHIFVGSDEIYDRQHEFLDLIAQRIVQPGFKISFDQKWCYDEYHNDLPCILPHSEFGNAYCNVEILSDQHPWVKCDDNNKFYHDTIIAMSIIHALLARPYQDEKINIGINNE